MRESTIHFWDMDHTVIDNDCDVSWKKFLIEKKIAPINALELVEFYWNQYNTGTLDLAEFLEFQLKEFRGRTEREVRSLAEAHFDTVVKSRIYPEARRIINDLRNAGNTLCLITSTNSVIAKPLADSLGVKHLLATNPEIADGRYTGKIIGEYCGGTGKIKPIKHFCHSKGITIDQCYYYGDSVVDIPVLEAIGHPVAVNPMAELKQTAIDNGWEILEFIF